MGIQYSCEIWDWWQWSLRSRLHRASSRQASHPAVSKDATQMLQQQHGTISRGRLPRVLGLLHGTGEPEQCLSVVAVIEAVLLNAAFGARLLAKVVCVLLESRVG